MAFKKNSIFLLWTLHGHTIKLSLTVALALPSGLVHAMNQESFPSLYSLAQKAVIEIIKGSPENKIAPSQIPGYKKEYQKYLDESDNNKAEQAPNDQKQETKPKRCLERFILQKLNQNIQNLSFDDKAYLIQKYLSIDVQKEITKKVNKNFLYPLELELPPKNRTWHGTSSHISHDKRYEFLSTQEGNYLIDHQQQEHWNLDWGTAKFSPDSHYLTLNDNGRITLLNLKTPSPLYPPTVNPITVPTPVALSGHYYQIHSIEFSNDGKLLASLSPDAAIIWTAQTQVPSLPSLLFVPQKEPMSKRISIKSHHEFHSICFSATSKYVVAQLRRSLETALYNTYVIWKLNKRFDQTRIKPQFLRTGWGIVTFHPDDRYMAVTYYNKMQLWNIQSDDPTPLLTVTDDIPIMRTLLCPKQPYVLVYSSWRILIANAAEGTMHFLPTTDKLKHLKEIKFDTDGNYLKVVTQDKKLVWKLHPRLNLIKMIFLYDITRSLKKAEDTVKLSDEQIKIFYSLPLAIQRYFEQE